MRADTATLPAEVHGEPLPASAYPSSAPLAGTEEPHAAQPTLAGVEAGLDALQSDAPPSSDPTALRIGKAVLAKAGPPLAAIAFLLVVWQVVVWTEVQPLWIVPSPAQVWTAFAETVASGTLATALGTTLERAVIAFLAAVAIATPVAIVIARVKWVRIMFGPIITGLQVLPSVAWVPVAILWFGLSNATVYFVVLMSSVPAIINGIVAGIDQVPPLLRRVGTVLGAGRVQMALHVVLPAALPGYLAGLKQGWAWAWRALLVSELIAVGGAIGFGLGTLLNQGRTFADMPLVIASTLVILVVGIAIELLVFSPLERVVLARRGLTR